MGKEIRFSSAINEISFDCKAKKNSHLTLNVEGKEKLASDLERRRQRKTRIELHHNILEQPFD